VAKKLVLKANNSRILTGDTIEIYNPSTMAFCGSYTVKSVDGTTLTLDKMINSTVSEGFIVGNVSGATHLTIDNCIFGNSYGRGGLIQCRDTKIINSTYFNISQSALLIHSSYDQYGEAIMPKNVLVENNKFLNCNSKQQIYTTIQIMTHNGSGGTTTGTLTDVHVNNNFFGVSGGGAVTFYGAGDSSCTNNLMYNLDRVQDNDLGLLDNCAIGIVCSSNITLKNNYVYITGANPKYEFIHKSEAVGLIDEKNTFKLSK
jgi:hypothetical protein